MVLQWLQLETYRDTKFEAYSLESSVLLLGTFASQLQPAKMAEP